jgi:hypothetical protein
VRSHAAGENVAVQPLESPAPDDDRLCPVCGDLLEPDPGSIPEEVREAAGQETTPGELDAMSLILAALNFRRCLEGTLASLEPDAGEEAVEATLLFFWLDGAAIAELRGLTPAQAFEWVVERTEAAGELEERIESLQACLVAAVAYAAEKCSAKAQPETPLDYVRVALAGLRHKRVSAHWTGRKPPGPGAQPRRRPKLEEDKREGARKLVKQVRELLAERDEQGRPLPAREIARQTGVDRDTVRRMRRELH